MTDQFPAEMVERMSAALDELLELYGAQHPTGIVVLRREAERILHEAYRPLPIKTARNVRAAICKGINGWEEMSQEDNGEWYSAIDGSVLLTPTHWLPLPDTKKAAAPEDDR